MTDDERRIITAYIERVSGSQQAQPAAAAAGPWNGTPRQAEPPRAPLPPVDREADALIGDLFQRHPEARYRITQTAFVQEAALVQAQNRLQQLEWELENQRRQFEAQAAQAPQQGGGLFGGLFGGGQRAQGRMPAPMPPPPQPMQPPMGAQAMMQPQGRGGSGFLGTALTTAAGVAGGMVLGNALMGMFNGGGAEAAGAAQNASSSWTDPGAAAAEQGWGGAEKGAAEPAAADQGGWDAPVSDQGNWDAAAPESADWGDSGGGDEEY